MGRDQVSIRLSRLAFTPPREVDCLACERPHRSRERFSLCPTCRGKWEQFELVGQNWTTLKNAGDRFTGFLPPLPATCNWCSAEVESDRKAGPQGWLCASCAASSRGELARNLLGRISAADPNGENPIAKQLRGILITRLGEPGDEGRKQPRERRNVPARRRRITVGDRASWLYDAHFLLRTAEPEPTWIGNEQITETTLTTMPMNASTNDVAVDPLAPSVSFGRSAGESVGLGVDAMIRGEYRFAPGVHVNPAHEKTGSPRGRPPEGKRDPDVVGAIWRLQDPAFSLEQYRYAAARAGRRLNGCVPIMKDLCRVVYGAKRDGAAVATLSQLIGLTTARLYALIAEGERDSLEEAA